MRKTRAIVREPSDSFSRCISSHPQHHSVSVKRAKLQHQNYCDVLTNLGLEVFKLPSDVAFPDNCFVEDTAIIHKDRVLISRMGAISRRGEEHAVHEFLSDYLKVKVAEAPATIEGGDVLHLPNYLVSGISQRTNQDGIQQLSDWLRIEVKKVIDDSIIHLKSHVTYLYSNTIIIDQKVANHPLFNSYTKILTPVDEEYATNSLTINKTVLLPHGFPKAKQLLVDNGFETITLNMSEYQKCEGALTCLSLLF
ncbi:MAG: dimethylarginine dimethylaminohydrolase family protein [Candidatus Hodarchaeales archaeon]|jgi:dimethylargininase